MICQKDLKMITNTHLKSHRISVGDYKDSFPDAPIESKYTQQQRSLQATIANLPRKGVPRTLDVKQKISKKLRGKLAWNKGVAQTEEQKAKQSETMHSKFTSGEIVHWNKGNKWSSETKKKIRESLLSQDLHMSPESIIKRNKALEEKRKCGWIHPSSLLESKEKMRRIMLGKHYGTSIIENLESPEWLREQHISMGKPLSIICKELGMDDKATDRISRLLKKYNIEQQYWFSSSYPEREIASFLSDLNISFRINARDVIRPKELDIYIPSKSLAIEYCGLFWHNENFLDNDYHYNKWRLCQDKNIRLLTIFEDEWMFKQEIVKKKIVNILGLDKESVYARKCSIVVVTTKTKNSFLDQYHIQGSGPGSINLGLTYCGDLVACISFVRKDCNQYILNRYATSVRVTGGFSKLLKHFITVYAPSKITTFADLRWSNGEVYEKNGFKLDGMVKPDYEYIVNGTRLHKFGFRHRSLKNKIPTYNPTLTERKNMLIAGIPRLWNCGKKRYVM